MLFWTIAATRDVTFAETVQVAPAASLPPARVMLVEPAVAVSVEAEPQEPFWPVGSSTTTPAERVSENAIPVSDPLAFGFVIVNDSVLVPPTAIEAGVNALVIAGGGLSRRRGRHDRYEGGTDQQQASAHDYRPPRRDEAGLPAEHPGC